MRALIFILSALAGAAPALGAPERLPPVWKQLPYQEARVTLLGLGWKPAPVPATERYCSHNADRCRYPETHACAATAITRCGMLWRKGATLIEVIVSGEGEAIVHELKCRIGCP